MPFSTIHRVIASTAIKDFILLASLDDIIACKSKDNGRPKSGLDHVITSAGINYWLNNQLYRFGRCGKQIGIAFNPVADIESAEMLLFCWRSCEFAVFTEL